MPPVFLRSLCFSADTSGAGSAHLKIAAASPLNGVKVSAPDSTENKIGAVVTSVNASAHQVAEAGTNSTAETSPPLARTRAVVLAEESPFQSDFDRCAAQLNNPNEFIRTSAVKSLARVQDPRVVEQLGEVLLYDHAYGVRAEAALALGDLGSTRAIAILTGSKETEKNSYVLAHVRYALTMALARITPVLIPARLLKRAPDSKKDEEAPDDRATSVVIKDLNAEQNARKKRAFRTLLARGDAVVDDLLKLFLSCGNVKLCSQVINLFLGIGTEKALAALDDVTPDKLRPSFKNQDRAREQMRQVTNKVSEARTQLRAILSASKS